MLAAGINSPEPLEELESHLRDEIERQAASGLEHTDAFEVGIRKIGEARNLEAEFAKNNKMEIIEMIRNSKIATWCSLAVVLLAAAWLTFCATMIAKELFPNDGLISMRASDGATVQVQHGVPTLMSVGTLQGSGEWHLTLIPALAIPFAILLAFAILGCCSLFRKQAVC